MQPRCTCAAPPMWRLKTLKYNNPKKLRRPCSARQVGGRDALKAARRDSMDPTDRRANVGVKFNLRPKVVGGVLRRSLYLHKAFHEHVPNADGYAGLIEGEIF